MNEIKNIEHTIQSYVRESFANVSLEIEIPPPELKSVLSTARILADDGVKGPLELKGDGLRRAVVFSILRAYVELARAAAKGEVSGNEADRGYLMLFEEPELFLHPGAQKILFDALGVFSKRHHVVVTTHSPLFLSPAATATFVRLSKTGQEGISKPFSKACLVELTGISFRDEFQIICYENNNAAFFSKRIVLVEGDSDLIVLPHIAETLDEKWNCRSSSVAFVRISGKGSIARYRSFFKRFEVPIFVITDLDTIVDGFDKLDPTEVSKALRSDLLQKVDKANADVEFPSMAKTEAMKEAQANPGIQHLWRVVREAKIAFDRDRSKYTDLDAAVDAFFAWEKKNIRADCIRKAEQADINAAKLALIWELRKDGIFVLEQGALEDYFPAEIKGVDKPSKAHAFRNAFTLREQVFPLSSQQTCPVTGKVGSEFEFIFSQIFS